MFLVLLVPIFILKAGGGPTSTDDPRFDVRPSLEEIRAYRGNDENLRGDLIKTLLEEPCVGFIGGSRIVSFPYFLGGNRGFPLGNEICTIGLSTSHLLGGHLFPKTGFKRKSDKGNAQEH